MLSLTMQVPLTSTASHGMMVPLLGMTMTSPGTRSVDRASSMSIRIQHRGESRCGEKGEGERGGECRESTEGVRSGRKGGG